MKKILFFIVLLLFPMTIFAKTPNKEETLKVIKNIENVTVIEGVEIESTLVDDEDIIFIINGEKVKIPYTFINNKLSFKGGYLLVDNNHKIVGDIYDNEYAFFLYSILENKSTIPYDMDNYFNTENIKKMVNEEFTNEYKEKSNTFGFELVKVEDNKYNIVYNYYVDGDYPVLEIETVGDDFTNPSTGNYSLLITVLLVSAVCIGIYTYLNPKKSN